MVADFIAGLSNLYRKRLKHYSLCDLILEIQLTKRGNKLHISKTFPYFIQ